MRIAVRLFIVTLLAAATSLQAITYIVPSDRELVRRAEGIVIATAVESHAELRDGGRIVTVATMKLEQVLKGSIAGENVQLVELGGVLADRATLIPGSPRYEDGKRYLVFLRTNAAGEWMTFGFGLGKFSYVADLTGRELLTRGESDDEIFGLDEADGSLHVERLRSGPQFLSFVTSTVASDAPARESYFVNKSDVVFATFPEFRPHASAFVPRALATRPDYLSPGNFRWQSPSASFFYCCAAQNGGSGLDGPSAATAAMGAWNGVSGAGISYSLSGSDPSPNPVPNGLGGAADGKNDILFNDPHGIIGNSGAAAVGGVSSTSGTYSLGDGATYFKTTEVDVETGNNIPSFINQSLFTQLLTHELGHTLGFRHADGSGSGPPPACTAPLPCASIGQAIMASTIFSGNSIGTLGQWDLDAAQTVYGAGPVCTNPAISAQPVGTTITAGQQATLSVTATGTSPTYQWYVGSPPSTTTPATNGTSSQLVVSPTSTTTYWVKVSGCSTSVNSNGATVTVNQPTCTPPTVSTPNASPSSIAAGQSSTLSVNPGGTSPFTYQWFQGNTGVTTTPIGTTSFVTVSPTVTTSYWVRVTGQCSPVADSPAVTVTVTCSPIASNVTAAPATINIGQSSTLSFNTTGSGPFTIQWFRGSVGDTSNPIQGSTTSILVSPTVTTAYWVHVTAPCGSQDGSVTVFVNGTVCIGPSIVTQPVGSTTSAGNSVTLTVGATGTAPLSYQWYVGSAPNTSTPAANGTGASLTVSPTTTTSYWVRVTNFCNGTQNADSNTATVTISVSCINPSITTQPANTSAGLGTSATLRVVAAGTSIHYQWYRGTKGDTTTAVGTDSATLVTNAISGNTNFWVRVTGACGTPADSNTVTVTATSPPKGRAVRH
jgi:hypothetical protein